MHQAFGPPLGQGPSLRRLQGLQAADTVASSSHLGSKFVYDGPPRKKRPATCGNSGSGSSVFWMTWTRYGPFRNILTTWRVQTSTLPEGRRLAPGPAMRHRARRPRWLAPRVTSPNRCRR